MLKDFARRILPASLKDYFRLRGRRREERRRLRDLDRMRRTVWYSPPGTNVEVAGHRVELNDGPNFYILYKDLFVRRLYHFEAARPDPRILDCGSNIGMSILYFKHVYPRARILGFEPDPSIFPILRRNLDRNGVKDVEVRQAALAGTAGTLTLRSDGKASSALATHAAADLESAASFQVPSLLLSSFLDEPIDLLKMNIEGAEAEVLEEAGDRLRSVREILLEYHHLPGLVRSLHDILGLFHRLGFEYLIHDFDEETNREGQPPFRLDEKTRYFLLVYARRRDDPSGARS